MDARLVAVALSLGSAANASVILPFDAAGTWKAVADRRHATVIAVRAVRPPDLITYATGVLIGDGYAVTTLHAVATPSPEGKMIPLRSVEVAVPDMGTMEARVIAGVPELDLAILALPGEAASVQAAPLSTDMPEAGEALVAMGAGGDAITVIGVVVSSVDGDLFALTSKRTLDSRFWGGPLFDVEGRLAGIQLPSLGAPSRAISARAIQRLIDERPAVP